MLEPVTTHPVLCSQCNHTFSHVAHPPITKAEIRSRHFLLPKQLGRLKAQIIDEQSELERWDEEISRLRSVLDNMQRHKDALSQQLFERRDFISASRRLPDEVWLKIFSLCVTYESKLSVSQRRWNKVIAESLRLSQVCSRWRDVITSSPSMWSSVHVNLFALKRDVVSVLERYLELGYRGGGSGNGSGNGEGAEGICHNNWYWNQNRAPRGIRNKTGEGTWTEHSQKAFSFLLRPENIRRFRRFDISDIDWQLPAATGDAAETQMNLPFLENLFLDARTRRDAPLVGLWKSIQRAPRLRWVKLGIHMSLSTSSLTTMLAHSQIRSLEIERVAELEGDVLDVVRLLPMLSNLENLRVGYIREEGSASLQVATSVDCPNLRRLTTQFGDGPGQTVFLRGLRLPLLEFLSVTGSYSTCTFELDTSESLISTLQNVAGTSLPQCTPIDR